MRKDVIGRNQTFIMQEALADRLGVMIPGLLHRVVFNAFCRAYSDEPKAYPDGTNPTTVARTSTLVRDARGGSSPATCGLGGLLFQLSYGRADPVLFLRSGFIGASGEDGLAVAINVKP